MNPPTEPATQQARETQTREREAPVIGEIGNRPLPAEQEKRQQSEFTFTQEQVELIKDTVAKGQNMTDDELRLFLYVAQRRRLDPLAKQIYAIRRKGKITHQTSIDGFRLIAARTGEYAGKDAPIFTGEFSLKGGKRAPESCSLTIYRFVQGQRVGFTAVSRFEEFMPEGDSESFMYRTKPFLMLAKVTEAQSLRAGFPEELGGLYTDDEMQQAGPSDATRAEQAVDRAHDPLSVSLNTPLPGQAGGWGGYAKAPLSSVPSEILSAVVNWATDKGVLAQDALDAGAVGDEQEKQQATARRMQEIVKRCELVIAARETGEVAEPPHKDGSPRGKAPEGESSISSPTDSSSATGPKPSNPNPGKAEAKATGSTGGGPGAAETSA